MPRFRMMLAAAGVMVVLSLPGSARAQAVMYGGGWPGLGYGGYYGVGFGYGSPAFGWGMASPYSYGGYGMGYGYNPYYGGYGPYAGGFYPYGYGVYSPPLTVTNMNPLIRTIQRTTGRRRGGWQGSW